MSVEQILVYLLMAGFMLLQLLGAAAKRRRENELERHAPAPDAPEPGERWRHPVPEVARPERRVEVRPPPPSPHPGASPRSDARPGQRQLAAQTRGPGPAEPAAQYRAALSNRAELRRAVQLMAILGPPRSRVPDDA